MLLLPCKSKVFFRRRLIPALALALTVFSHVLADEPVRTWTTADGASSFEGAFRSFNYDTQLMQIVADGEVLDFPVNLLSEADLNYIRSLLPPPRPREKSPEAILEEVESSALGAQIQKAKPYRFDGRRYRRTEFQKTPDFYILYYAASW